MIDPLLADISNTQVVIGAGVMLVSIFGFTHLAMSRLDAEPVDDPDELSGEESNPATVSSRVAVPRAKRIQPAQGGEPETPVLNPLPAANPGLLVPGGTLATAGGEAGSRSTGDLKEAKLAGPELTAKEDIAAALAGLTPASMAAKGASSGAESKPDLVEATARKEPAAPVAVPPLASLVEMKSPTDKPAPSVAIPPLAVGGSTPSIPAASATGLVALGGQPGAAKPTEEAKGAAFPPAPVVPSAGLVAMNQPTATPPAKPMEKSAVFSSPAAEPASGSLIAPDKPTAAGPVAAAPAGPASPEESTDVKKQKTSPSSAKPEPGSAGLILIPPSSDAPVQAAPAKPEPEPEPKSTGRPRIFMPANQPAVTAKPEPEKLPVPVVPVPPVLPAAAAAEAVPETPAPLAGAAPVKTEAALPAADKVEAAPAKGAAEPAPAKPGLVAPEAKTDVPPIPPLGALGKPAVEPSPVMPSASLIAAKPETTPTKAETSAAKPEMPTAKPEPKKEAQPPAFPAVPPVGAMTVSPAKTDLPPEDGTPGAPLAPEAPASSARPTAPPVEPLSAPATTVGATPSFTPATPAPAASVTTPPPKMALTESTTNVPANARAAAQLTLGFEITSLQLTPFFKLGAVQLRPLSNVVSLHLIASQAADNPLAAGISFQIVTVDLNEAQHIRSILLKPLMQSQPATVPQPKLQVDTVQITRAGENAPIEIRSSDQTSTAVQLIADFTIAAMDFTPSFEIGSLRLEPTSNSVLLRLAASQKPTALDLPPSFEVANVQLAGDAQFAAVRLTPGTAPKPA